jgi:hypothetical protein
VAHCLSGFCSLFVPTFSAREVAQPLVSYKLSSRDHGKHTQKAISENFARQLKFAQKNRKDDGRKGKDLSLSVQEIVDVWTQVRGDRMVFLFGIAV